MFMHPSISTNMFHVFNCIEVQYDNEDLTAQYWLAKDTAHECNNLNWYISATVSVFTVIVFVLGFPVSLFLAMWRLRQFHAVRLPRIAAERHIAKVERGEWIPCDSKELAMARLHRSFLFHLNLRRRESVKAALNGPVPWNAAVLAWRWWQRVNKRKSLQANSWVDMYIPRDAFLSGVGGEEAIEQQEKLLEVNWGACNTGRVCRARSRNSLARAETTRVGLRSWIILRDGSLIIDAEALTKEDTGDRGVIQMVPVTRLDAPNFSKAFALTLHCLLRRAPSGKPGVDVCQH
ncbi:hypothetical protein CYMTET_29075 [Cymbomonas tetramitiformis]|uniref:Uncharacterized protein n=1 Tax=Cymbomonas tetramitiformis TaxID=36881 RepID=A0AAE0FLT4_9CHLO|nr:hypothetical protein CYMTET_29075 [Cymbomonas tetramitiformis]